MSVRRLGIRAEGIACSLPGTTEEVAQGIIRGKASIERHPTFVGMDGLPQEGCWVDSCLEERETVNRHMILARAAIDSALQSEGGQAVMQQMGPSKLPFIVATPSASSVGVQVFARLEQRLCELVHDYPMLNPRIIGGDRVAAAEALERAWGPLEANEAPAAMVLAIDSACTPQMLDRIAVEGRARRRSDPYSSIPGEAGIAFLVSDPRRQPRANYLAFIDQIAFAKEEQDLDDPARSLLGRGLGHCIREVLEQRADEEELRLRAPGVVVTDMTPERFRAEDYGSAVATLPAIGEAFLDPIVTPLSIGDVGVAHGLIGVCVARQALDSSSDCALVVVSARRGDRAAMRISIPSGTGMSPLVGSDSGS